MTKEQQKQLNKVYPLSVHSLLDELTDKIFDDFEQNLLLEDTVEVNEQGYLTNYPQFGRFSKGKKICIYTKEL